MDNCKQFVSTLNHDTPYSASHIRHSPRYSGFDRNDHAHVEPFVAMSRMSSVQKPGDSFHGAVSNMDCLFPFQNSSKSLRHHNTRLQGDSTNDSVGVTEYERFRWRDGVRTIPLP